MRTCSVEGCEKKHNARGYCSGHYYARKQTGEFNLGTCKKEGCEEVHEAKGYCRKHYLQAKRNGEFGQESAIRYQIVRIYHSMQCRCLNPNSIGWDRYGGRGITICHEWGNLESFYKWAIKGYRPGLQIDRIDNSKGYSPDNCRWVTPKQQCRNRKDNIWVGEPGEKFVLIELAEIYNLNYITLHCRYHRGDRGARLVRPVER